MAHERKPGAALERASPPGSDSLSAAAYQQVSPTRSTDALATARLLIGDELEAVNHKVIANLVSDVPMIPEVARHLIAAGGKRIRPVLTLLSAKLCGYQGDRQIGLATAVEFIHTATLLHDDVVDESDLRRGRNTANAVWGNKPPVLVGDFLFSRAFQLMVADGNLKVLKILSDAAAIIAEGEVAQLMTANDMSTDETAYYHVIRGKTAALFRAATQVGAVIADRTKDEETALAVYGEELGIAFQLVDDALDYSARQAMLGKTVGDDFVDGKVTLPVILSYADGDEKERAFWRRTMEEQKQTDTDLKHALKLIARHRGIERTLDAAQQAAARASGALDIFAAGDIRDCMTALAEFSVSRAY